VEPAFAGDETPDPRAQVPGHPAQLGYLLSVVFDGPWELPLGAHLSEASLTPEGGQAASISPQDVASGMGAAAVEFSRSPRSRATPGTPRTSPASSKVRCQHRAAASLVASRRSRSQDLAVRDRRPEQHRPAVAAAAAPPIPPAAHPERAA
jgi:hypothetical protein